MEVNLTIPVLLIAFNRPETTTVVFEYIRRAKPTKLYVALDGARVDKPYEDILCREVRRIVERADWDCDVQYKVNEQNFGAEVTVSEALIWVFKKEESVIVLEDDTISPISFFRFAQEMLIKYKDDNRLSIVSSINKGNNFFGNFDYTFAKYGHTPCFGTWRRAWEGFNLNIEIEKQHTGLSFLRKISNSDKEARYYQKKFKHMRANGVGNSTWDSVALYQNRINNQLAIIPRINLSSNIGIEGLHARGKTNSHFRTFDESFIATKHPAKVECNIEFDKYHFENHIYKKNPFYKRIMRKIGRILLNYTN